MHRVSTSITERDKQLCLSIFDNRFLTTHQSLRLFFESYTRARTRLLTLYRMRVLDRFRPHRKTGSHPHYYVLDEVGLHIVAAIHGRNVKDLKYDRLKALGHAYSPRLLHSTEVNDFFSRLMQAARHRGIDTLWVGERSCRSNWRGFIHPDGFGSLRTRGRSISFWLELDGGTEIRSRLGEKLDRYASVGGAEGTADALLFTFPSHEREASAREVLVDCGLVVATGVLADHMTDPFGNNWLPVGSRKRSTLLDLTTQLHEKSA